MTAVNAPRFAGSNRRRAGSAKALKLPSGGDTSYAGLVLHNGLLWVSYYSSHEEKTAIYLAKVKLDRQTAVSTKPMRPFRSRVNNPAACPEAPSSPSR